MTRFTAARSPKMRIRHHDISNTGDFVCQHCHNFVTASPMLSGVQNRNHCPYCLWSRHLDSRQAGDRLSACKSQMRPIGLTLKKAHKKYGQGLGELMVIHHCVECGKLSINRIAADDDPQTIYTILHASTSLDDPLQAQIGADGIDALEMDDLPIVQARLFGKLGCENAPTRV